MRWKYVLILLTTLSLSTPVFAEFYQYRDENGVLKFTDDLTQVPKDQRPDVKTFLESKNILPSSEQENTSEAQKADVKETFSTENKRETSEENSYLSQFERLNKKKANLDQRYKDLVKAKDALRKMRDGDTSEVGKKAYNTKVNELNQRITDFERDRDAFSKEVEALNQKFEK